uniref:Protein kinase domain-containing protein n=1 Tax=Parascaris univalens TaxID=6257 RepID=A0A914ZH05_PARUN
SSGCARLHSSLWVGFIERISEGLRMATIPEEKDRLPKVDDEIKSDSRTYKLLRIIGEGGYGIIFESFNSERRVAIKTEKYSKSMLHIEARVMRISARHRCQHFCELFDYGIAKPDFVFIVITLVGKDLHKLRNEQYERRFSLSTAIRVGTECFKAIEELHGCGYISRDIKPGNFAVGLREYQQHRTIFLFDFGLAKRYLDKNGNHLASRGEVGWRGTTRYGSLKAHQRLDLGRRDDLESWFYLLVEITRGTLPWRHVSQRPGVQAAKSMSRNAGRKQFLHDCPRQYDEILTMIDALAFQDEPKYSEIRRLLDEVRKEHGIRMHSRFDWDEEGTSTRSSTMTTSTSDKAEVAIKEEASARKKSAENLKEKENNII